MIVGLIGWGDYATGPDIGFSLFYLLPVIFAGWFFGVTPSVLVAIAASAAWIVADSLWAKTTIGITAWNGFTRLAIFVGLGVTMAKLREERENMKKLNAELESFSYSVSHDLRSPVTHVHGYAEMLIKHAGNSLDEVSHRYVRTISESAETALSLIDNLLAFSRLQRADLERKTVDLNPLVDEVRSELLMSDSAARNIEWRVKPLPTVTADDPMLRVVFQNLLSNALKYTRPRANAVIEVGSYQGDGEDVVFVRDNGVGFDPKYTGKLFRVFERLHSSSEFKGSGIGLATVARIISRHHGRTWAEGEVDRGATFYFSLPQDVKR
jgi:light-regulated signal transduction histidine kinase (bacteriophytochrome)